MYVKIVNHPINVEEVISMAKTADSGCVASYVGLIRDNSHDKQVKSVEYRDEDGQAEAKLKKLAEDIMHKYPVNGLSMCHRIGILEVSDINIVFAFGCGHRQEAFAACAYAVDKFKEMLPTSKTETYIDGTVNTKWD